MRALGHVPVAEWPDDAYTLQQIRDKLTLWREHLIEYRAGGRTVLTLSEILRELDRWLDELLDLRGR